MGEGILRETAVKTTVERKWECVGRCGIRLAWGKGLLHGCVYGSACRGKR